MDGSPSEEIRERVAALVAATKASLEKHNDHTGQLWRPPRDEAERRAMQLAAERDLASHASWGPVTEFSGTLVEQLLGERPIGVGKMGAMPVRG